MERGMRLVLLGAPGSGKGTQAEFFKKHKNLEHISTGAILREHVKERTKLGLEAKKYMDAGELVPDVVVMEMVFGRLQEIGNKGYMLDGFPRTEAQAKFLDNYLKQEKDTLDAVIFFDVPDEEIIRRLTSRLMCSSCGGISSDKHEKCPLCGGELYRREDDREEVIKSRLKVFHEQNDKLLKFYEAQGLLHKVKATGDPEDIFMRLIRGPLAVKK